MTIKEIKAKLERIIERPHPCPKSVNHAIAKALTDRARVEAIALYLLHGFERK